MSIPSIEDAYRLNQVIQGSPDATGISPEWAGVAAAMLQCNGNGDRSQAFMDAIKDMVDYPQILKVVVANRQPGEGIQPFRVYTGTEMAEFPEPDWQIEDILIEGQFSLLAGAQASLKSFIGLDMSACISCGISWQGFPTKQGAILYIVGEGVGGIGRRIRAWEQHYGRAFPPEVQFIRDRVTLGQDMRNSLGTSDVDKLLFTVESLKYHPSLIWLDTVARGMGAADENSTRDMGAFVQVVDRIRMETGAGFGGMHHLSRMGNVRGNTALGGAIDTEILVKRAGELVTLECSKQKDGPEFRPITLRSQIIDLGVNPKGKSISSLVLNRIDTPSLGGLERKLMDILHSTFGQAGATATQWQSVAESEGIPRASFYRGRTELVENSRLVILSGKNYRLSDPTEKAV